MTLENENLLKNLETELVAWDRSQSCVNQYPLVVKRYLASTKPENIFTRAGVNEYLARLTKEKKGGSTKRFVYYIIKKLFQVNGQEWPFGRGAPPKTPPHEVKAPAMSSEDIKAIIKTRDRLEDWQAGVMALNTTYGVRQAEILRVRSDDIQDGKIFIHTVKHGTERWHILPEEIAPYVEAWASLDSSQRPAKATLFVEFHKIAKRCGITTDTRGMGYHSIRRQLATELLQSGLNPAVIYQFLRWQLSSALGILGTYSHIPDDECDKLVFEHHPFLYLWKEGKK